LVSLLAGALVVALTNSACVVMPNRESQANPPSPAQKSAAQVPPSGRATLTRFYKQDLAWSDCGPNQCARLTVPIDYSHPHGETLQLALLRVPATSPARRIGSLVVNPGGPGGSGVDYVSAAVFTKQVSAVYDIVGFDPRGVGRSSPVKCLNDREVDSFLGADPTPDDKTEEQQLAVYRNVRDQLRARIATELLRT